jgi:aminomethyltransferase
LPDDGDALLNKTTLNQLHRDAGARMVDFGGWDMPVHYGSQIEEHHAVRRGAGLFDVSHMLAVDVQGRDARDFLRRALGNNVDKLKTPGKALYSCMLAEDGGVVDDLIVYFFRDDFFRLVVNAGAAQKDIAWLRDLQSRWSRAVTLLPRRELAIVALQGPQARRIFGQVYPDALEKITALKPFNAAEIGDMMVARTGYTGEDGFEIVLPDARVADAWRSLVAAGARACGLGARDTLRLEAGMNLYGQDMDERVSPLDAGLAWTVDLESPRDFVGKAALQRQGQRSEFLGLLLLESGGVLRAHQKVETKAGEGMITSGTFSPTLGQSIGLARLPLGTGPGDTVRVQVRDKSLAARVVSLPFVRNGKTLVNPEKDAS